MNARQVRAEFRRQWAEACARQPALRTDKPAMREAFNNLVDSLARSGQITERVADSVTLEG